MLSPLRKFLTCLVLFSLIFEIVRFYEFTNEFSSWQYGDWLINYQGGLVRRGLIGHILFSLHKFLHIDLDSLIFIFVSFLYFFVSFFLIKSIKFIDDNIENLLIFLSPGFFIYPIMNSGIIGRKDIFLIFFVVLFVFFEKKISNKYILISFLIALVLLCFSHSGFVFYSQYLFFLFILIKHNRNLSVNKIDLLAFTLTLVFIILFIITFDANQLTIDNICLSVKDFVSENCATGGQIYHLSDSNTNIRYRLFEKINLGSNYIINYFIIYGLSAFVVFFFISKKTINSKINILIFKFQLKKPFVFFLLLFILTIPAFVLGRDWGRYIYMSYSCIFFIYIYCIKEKILIFNNDSFKLFKNKFILVIFILFYSFFVTFPYYDASSFKVTLRKPIMKILDKIN